MSRKKTFSGRKKLALLAGAVALAGGTAVIMTGTSQASVVCDGLATALRNNEDFIAAQRATPDALSEARIANRVAVIEEIRLKQRASGCDSEAGGESGSEDANAGGNAGTGADTGATGGGGDATAAPTDPAGAAGEVVCAGSTVTLSGEAGPPAASSNQFPAGTVLRVTNLDNNKSTTVEVTSVSGSCALLNDAAFELVREDGKFLIRRALIERVQSVESTPQEPIRSVN
ncbi:RlpA-like double-psi beta-barrel domain-containing protein [Streptomyces paludis]|uniref:Secreted protein n=1 Tax=Streptomyces paludis TaxID=2282738 RepID=A0A345HLA4_9ACTN|nr:hypothetical protein [Streptomyces paludis]AXG77478.1 hypothetical protein DVK44_06970 [Streptomyces paludis]